MAPTPTHHPQQQQQTSTNPQEQSFQQRQSQQGYYQQTPPPGYYQQQPQVYYQQPQGYYYQQPQQGYYRQPPPQGYYQQQPTIIIVDDTDRDETYRRGRRLDDDTDESGRFSSSFSTKQIRAAFVRKVYTLLMIMLGVATGMCALFIFIAPVREFVQKNWWLILIAFLVYFVVFIILVCFKEIRRKSPINIILLGIFTLAASFILAVATAYYDTLTVLMALASTVGLCLLVTLFACQSKVDITGCGAYLCILLLSFILFSLVAFIIQIFIKSKILHLIVAGLGTALFSLFLMYDTQQIMGGKRVEINPEEYVYGALTLYLDVILIFMYLLQIFAICRGG